MKPSVKPVVAPIRDPRRSDLLNGKRKEFVTWKAFFSGSPRLQEASLSLISAVGTKVMRWTVPLIVSLGLEHDRACGRRRRMVSAFKFKSAVEFYHLLFKIQKRVQNRHLRLLSPDQLVLELHGKFDHLGGRYPSLVCPFDKLPELFAQIDAAANEADRQISTFKKTIHVHSDHPNVDATKPIILRKGRN